MTLLEETAMFRGNVAHGGKIMDFLRPLTEQFFLVGAQGHHLHGATVDCIIRDEIDHASYK